MCVCKLARYVRNCVVFWKTIHSWQKFYTTAGRGSRDKFQVWELYSAISMQFKFFWEKVDVDVQRKDQQCYWSSFVRMAAIDTAEVPHFQRKYNKLQIATSTGRLISNWIFEMIDLWPWVEANIESILLQVVFWENGSDGERGAGGGVARGASQSTRVNRPEINCGSTAAVNTQLSVVNWQLTKVMI